MNIFRTVVKPDKAPFHIEYTDKLISIGSCFSENIGKKLAERKFDMHINPFGQQYNPISVCNAIHRLLNKEAYTENDLVLYEELYHSFDHHGSFSRGTADETLEHINRNLAEAANALANASVLFLTFGTSHVFELKETGKTVSNCHKMPGKIFNKRLLKPDEIQQHLTLAIDALRKINPGVKIILTVSPVRYFAFGHHENTISKAHLFTAIHEWMQQDDSLYYFPAYELVMDDLRDYRFFAEDMLHPNYQATQYVWEVMCQTFMSHSTLQQIKTVEEILSAASHRPRNPQSDAHRAFVKKYLTQIELLEKEGMDFSSEKARLSVFN